MIRNRTFAGIGVGTTMTKAWVMGGNAALFGQAVQRSGADLAAAAMAAFEGGLARAGVTIEAVHFIVAEGGSDSKGTVNAPLERALFWKGWPTSWTSPSTEHHVSKVTTPCSHASAAMPLRARWLRP